jgi:hypothetical protein
LKFLDIVDVSVCCIYSLLSEFIQILTIDIEGLPAISILGRNVSFDGIRQGDVGGPVKGERYFPISKVREVLRFDRKSAETKR